MTALPVARVATRPDYEWLSPGQRAELLRILIDARTALRERARMLAIVDGSFDASSATWGHGETEHTAIDVERRVNGVLGTNTRVALSEVAHALARFDEGIYGRCLDCRNPIPYERLLAKPTARLCVRCQQRRDRDR
jgi:RNA polymerase-binding transcription factor DksA